MASHTQFTLESRIMLSALLRAKVKKKDIAIQLQKDRTTISRECSQNSKPDGTYHAGYAQRLVDYRRVIAKQSSRKIENSLFLQQYIIKKLKKKWSPDEIAGRMKKNKKLVPVSHETIYIWIYTERPELKKYLRCKKGKYRRKRGTKQREKHREEAKKRRIDTRPIAIDERKELGHWEGDTVIGTDRTSAIATHTERVSGYAMAAKLERKTAEAMKETTIKLFKNLPKNKRKTETLDNGTEMSSHKETEKGTGMIIYFAYPYHSWERGSNENFNGLLREYFPKGTSFKNITQKDIDYAIHELNHRPRKRLNYYTPHEVFIRNVAFQT